MEKTIVRGRATKRPVNYEIILKRGARDLIFSINRLIIIFSLGLLVSQNLSGNLFASFIFGAYVKTLAAKKRSILKKIVWFLLSFAAVQTATVIGLMTLYPNNISLYLNIIIIRLSASVLSFILGWSN